MKALLIYITIFAVGQVSAGTITNSSQETKSQSSDRTITKSAQAEKKSSNSTTVKLSVNAELLNEYIKAFERGGSSQSPCETGFDTKPIPYARQREALIRISESGDYVTPLSNPRSAFPAYDGESVVRADKLRRNQGSYIIQDYVPQVTETNGLVRAYLFEFAYANAVISQAAKGLENKQVSGDAEARSTVRRALCNVDYAKAFDTAVEVVESSKCLGMPLPQADSTENGFTHALVLDCGAIQIDADKRAVRILGRTTLDQSMINGRDITLTLARDESSSITASKSKSKNSRDSTQTTKQHTPE